MTPDYHALPVHRLRELCRERGLRVSGPTAELIARLEAADTAHADRDDEGRVEAAAAVPAPVAAARKIEQRLGGLPANAGATWHRAQQRVEEAARRLVAAADLGLDERVQRETLRRELAGLDEAAAAYVKAARRALG